MRVLHVISGLFHGGGQRVTEDLCAVLPDVADVEVRLCTLGEGAPIAECADDSIPYDGRYNRPSVLWHASRALGRIIDARDADIIHTHGVDADLIGSLTVLNRSTRQLCHLHISPPSLQGSSWRSYLRRSVLHMSTSRNQAWFLAVSEAVRAQMIPYYGLPADRVVTVRNGIDTETFRPCRFRADERAGPVVIGTAARLAPMKGLEHLLDAAGRLKQRGSAYLLKIAGSGTLLGELQRQAQSAGIADRVEFVGQVNDMCEFYHGLDVFVLPSVSTEGLPLTVLEAMASALPVVATTVGGTAEAVRNDVDGWVIPPGDAETLSGALEKLILSASLRARMGRSGRERAVGEFSRERVASQVYDVYCRVLDQQPATTVVVS